MVTVRFPGVRGFVLSGMPALTDQFGPIDIYLFDQLLRGRLKRGMSVLDAGCGGGRNLVWLLRNAVAEGFGVFGADADPVAIQSVRSLAARFAPELTAENFRVERVEEMSFPDASADVVISSAVLHFATDDAQFEAMLRGSWRVLKPGGLFFCRLASSIGMEREIQPLGGRRYRLPDGSARYLVDAALLAEWEERLGASRVDPLKTTVVQNQRSMTTWVLRAAA